MNWSFNHGNHPEVIGYINLTLSVLVYKLKISGVNL